MDSVNYFAAKTPEKWTTPEEVMKLHRLRLKKKALQARMNRSDSVALPSSQLNTSADAAVTKRKNPFRSGASDEDLKKQKSEVTEEDTNCDNTLFKLLNISKDNSSHLNFKNILNRITPTSYAGSKAPPLILHEGSKEPPVDWTLRTKVRFMSTKPFPWSTTLRTCEEASGVTGFVRCTDTSINSTSKLDTSPSAQFHQCCLVWQHPSLPWLELYPRQSKKGSASTPTITLHQSVKDALHMHWADSFRSLYQLLRARQCSYFYFVSNTFICLFRAAGVCGYPHTHALITPTTRGLRKTLRDQDIAFRMPLRSKRLENEDTGYDTLDASQSPEASKHLDLDEDDGEEAERWLESMGVEAAEIKKIRTNQADAEIGKEKMVDRRPESLVLVEDIEAHMLFNWLLNCKSCIATTGPLAGVPPTLMSPVAFHGGTLRVLKVRESKVQVGTDRYYSVEVRGPILPTAVQQMCDLLCSKVDQYSLTLASQDSTKAFTLAGTYVPMSSPDEAKENEEAHLQNVSSVFCEEGLSDCGQSSTILRRICSKEADTIQYFDCLKFSDNLYSWT